MSTGQAEGFIKASEVYGSKLAEIDRKNFHYFVMKKSKFENVIKFIIKLQKYFYFKKISRVIFQFSIYSEVFTDQ